MNVLVNFIFLKIKLVTKYESDSGVEISIKRVKTENALF